MNDTLEQVPEQTDAPAVTTMRPIDLRNYEGPLYASNNTRTIISHSTERGGQQLRLGPKGSDEEMAPLPLEVAQHPTFQKAWRMGKVTVTTDPEMEALLELADARGAAREEAERLAREVTIEDSLNDKDLLPTQCVGCGQQVFQSKKEADAGAPPLCFEHEDMAASLVSESYWDNESKKMAIRWIKPNVTATQKGTS